MTNWLKLLHLLGKHDKYRCEHDDGWHCSLCEPDKFHRTEDIAEGKTLVLNGRLVTVKTYRPTDCLLPKEKG